MMDFLVIVGGILMALVIWTVATFILMFNKKFQKWLIKHCFELQGEIEEL